jgi:hypothetical protein
MQYAFLLGAILSHEMAHIKMRIHNTSIKKPLKRSPDKFHKESGVYVEDRLLGGEISHEAKEEEGKFSLESIGIEVCTRNGTSKSIDAKFHVTLKDIEKLFSKQFWIQNSLNESSIRDLLMTPQNKFDKKSFERDQFHKMARYNGRVLGHDPENEDIVH